MILRSLECWDESLSGPNDTCISAVICTLNRADYLRKALRSLVYQTLPDEQYEILVVDNGSTDNTKQVVLGEFSHVPNLRFLHEPLLGLSQARNTGWHNAVGEYVAYMDDDAIASPQWLETILNVFETIKPQPGCVGGKIEPIWEVSRPPWLSDKVVPHLAVLDWSRTPIILNDKQYVAGANIAFPRRLLEITGGFPVSLGRKGNKLLSNEELLLQRKLKDTGYHCFYDPEIAVWHHIPASRLRQGWFARRMYWQGASEAIVQMHQESPSTTKRLRMVVRAAGSLLLSPRRLGNLVVPTNNADRFESKCSVLAQIGYVSGLLGIAK
jgi:glycosyltransferase involved in cell wall biosynthesis